METLDLDKVKGSSLTFGEVKNIISGKDKRKLTAKEKKQVQKTKEIVTKFGENLVKSFKVPTFNLPTLNDPLSTVDLSASLRYQAEKNAEEAEIRRLTLAKLRKENSSVEENPSYNLTSSQLTFTNQSIQIPADTDQDALCRVLLKNETSLKKVWPMDELQEEILGTFESTNWRKVYYAAREINQKVAVKTSITDFLIITTKTVALNPKYLKKS